MECGCGRRPSRSTLHWLEALEISDALRLCSLVAPCPRPFWAQRNTSQLRDTTLGLPFVVSASPHSSRLRYLQVAPSGRITIAPTRWARLPCPLCSATRPSPTPPIGTPPSRPH